MWELEEGGKDTPPSSSDQQEEGPRGSAVGRAMLPSNSETLLQTHQIPNSSALIWENQSPDLIPFLPPSFPLPFLSGFWSKSIREVGTPEAPDVFVIWARTLVPRTP